MKMKKYTILLLGSGGRESALAWKLSQSPRLKKLYIAPGNGGTLQYGTNVGMSPKEYREKALHLSSGTDEAD